MAETRFGRDAVSDPNLLSDLRAGKRLPGLTKLNRLADFMARKDAAADHGDGDTAAIAAQSPGKHGDISASETKQVAA